MKKLFLLVVAAAVGFLIYQKVQADRAEQELWEEATADTLDLR